MRHMKDNDKMMTIHKDRLIPSWELKPSITVDDVRGVFDFSLVKSPCYDVDGREIPGLYHVERVAPGASKGEIMPIGGFGPTYTILQHSEVLGMIADKIMPELPGAKIETAGTLDGGATGIVQISLGKDFNLAGDTSAIENRLYFSNPIGGGSLVMGFCVTRCICENTIALARQEVIEGARTGEGYVIRHTNGINVYAQRAVAEIAAQAKATEVMKARLRALAAKKATPAQVKAALAEIYPATPEMADKSPTAYTFAINRREEVITQWESGETAQTFKTDSAWKLVNAFTFPIFNPARTAKGTDVSGVRYDGLFGERADKVSKIVATVERIAA